MLLRPALVFCSVFISPLLAQQGDRPGEVQAPPPAHINTPPAPALSPEEEAQTFKMAPGFRVELVAAEPLVRDPVTMAFGGDGRLWVVEMRSYMPNIDGKGEDEPIGSIAILSDTNGDGRMDKRTVFLDGLVMPRAISLIGDGALVAEPPRLWLVRDTNGDGVADQKTEVAPDYAATGNPEHMANGLMWAMDNWIYSAKHNVRFRYEGGGKFTRDQTIPRGQWGLSQDDVGRIYYNTNSDPIRVDLIASEYLERNRHISPAGTNAQLVPSSLRVWPSRVTPGINRGYRSLDQEGKMLAMTAACGPLVYRGSLFPAEYRGNVFVCEPSGQLVKRIVLEERDGTLKGRNAYEGTEFMTSTDERFRPVNAFDGPDGALYLVDMYRGVIQHKTFVTTYLRKQVEERGLEQPVGKGRIWRVVPESASRPALGIDLDRASEAELVQALGSENGWTRDTAQRILVQRGLDSVRASSPAAAGQARSNLNASLAPALVEFSSKAKTPLGRLHALWTLDGLGLIDKPTVLGALADPDTRVVAAAVRLAGKFLSPPVDAEIFDRLAAHEKHQDASVRLQLALSFGDARSVAGDAILRRLLAAHPAQPFLSDAIVSGLAGREDAFVEALIAEVKDAPSAPGALVSLATNAVLKSGDAPRIDRLLTLVDTPTSSVWARRAILDGVQRFIPRSSDGRTLTASLPREPKALVDFAKLPNNPDAERAGKLLAGLRWPGKAGMQTTVVAELTPVQKALFEKGRAQFTALCAACHQPAGQGLAGLAPPIVNSRWVLGDDRILARILLCGKVQENMIMPPLKALDDEALAGVLTFVRRSFGHEAAPVSPATIREQRAAVAGREEPLSNADLEKLLQEFSGNPAAKK